MDEVLLGVAGPAMTCTATLSRCACVLPPGHEVHKCDCGGSWKGVEGEPGFKIVSYPEIDDTLSVIDVMIASASGVRRGGIRWPIPAEEADRG